MSRLLRVRGLRKSYRSGDAVIEVLCGLDLDLEEGTMLAVSGESGSGKSTFLHLVGAMEPPDAGRILFRERDLQSMNPGELAEFRNQSIGFVFQFHHLLPEFSAAENVMFPLLLRGLDFAAAARRAAELLTDLGLEGRMSHQPGELSGGEQQRVAIARALVGRPSLLLADEPSGNLDERMSRGLHELLLEVHRRHRLTSIVVTHNPALAALCGEHLRMEEGRLRKVE